MDTASFSKKGRDKPNQDSITSISINGKHLIAISDGMGGKYGGEIASSSALDAISESFKINPELPIESLFEVAHKRLVDLSISDTTLSEMGATLSICLINTGKASIGHVGDTRIYHLRNEGIVTRTKDQTELQHLLEEGVITKRKAKNYKRKNILLSVLTPSKSYELFTAEFDLIQQDRLILCSDGFYSLVSKSEIKDLSIALDSIDDLASELLKLVESKDINDDYSCLIYQK
ncbi:MAG: PP2C family protein-serine/threonine phosphatase [Cellvibrionaceae bacterium]